MENKVFDYVENLLREVRDTEQEHIEEGCHAGGGQYYERRDFAGVWSRAF